MVDNYPIEIGLAYLFLAGYLMRTLFIWARLPGAVGAICNGIIFSHFMQDGILYGRNDLQSLSFFLVLLTAGFEISIGDLSPFTLACAIIPATMEMLGVAAYSWCFMNFSIVEGLVLGNALFSLGDGLVIPKMLEFGKIFPKHPLPKLVFTWAPIEASYALTLFGVLRGVSQPADETTGTSFGLVIFGNVLRVVATLGGGALVGASAGWFIQRRTSLRVMGRPIFTGANVEAYLIIVSVALAGHGLGADRMMPIGLIPGSIFQPELMVIVIGCFFAHVMSHDTLEQLEEIVGGVWVFGQLVLFSMIGSKTDMTVFAQLKAVLPLMATGLTLRFIGIFAVMTVSSPFRRCNCVECSKGQKSSILADTCFCFLSCLPRGTIQGALGAVPATERFFKLDASRHQIQTFISMAGRLYIVIMAVAGSIFLDLIGTRILESHESRHRPPCVHDVELDERVGAEQTFSQEPRRDRSISAPAIVFELEAKESRVGSKSSSISKSNKRLSRLCSFEAPSYELVTQQDALVEGVIRGEWNRTSSKQSSRSPATTLTIFEASSYEPVSQREVPAAVSSDIQNDLALPL